MIPILIILAEQQAKTIHIPFDTIPSSLPWTFSLQPVQVKCDYVQI